MTSFLRSRRLFLVALVGSALVAEFAILYYFLILAPEKPPTRPPEILSKEYLIKLEGDKIPHFTFSKKEIQKLEEAFKKEEEYLLKNINHQRKLPFGEGKLSSSLVKESAELLIKTLKESKTEEELNKLIRERFLVYQAAGQEGEGEVLFTGYYSPLFEGSLKKHGPYKYPLYLKPEDLKSAKLGEFDPSLEGEKIFYRIDTSRGEIVPYWSREDIVQDKILEGKSLEFVYLKNRVDRFYLMIEGSGKILLDNGETFWARYAAKNGRPYTSPGTLLAEEGKLPRDKLSLQSIREYFQKHPHLMDRYLLQNEAFVFFTRTEGKGGAVGAAGCELTPEVSIAVDKRTFPLGTCAYIQYSKPKTDSKSSKDTLANTQKEARFVFCQDTGGVIRGPGRADIYFGEGEKALHKAGHLKNTGGLYFLIKKER